MLTDWLFASPSVTDEREIEKERMGRGEGSRRGEGRRAEKCSIQKPKSFYNLIDYKKSVRSGRWDHLGHLR